MARLDIPAAVAIVLIAAAVGPARLLARSASAEGQDKPVVNTSTYGHDSFEFYCASCHGLDGKGHGPAAARLKQPVPDLTTLSARNSGVFPRLRVQSTITGDDATLSPTHGTREMPVWGPIFRWLAPGYEGLTTIRVGNLVDYIESLQGTDR